MNIDIHTVPLYGGGLLYITPSEMNQKALCKEGFLIFSSVKNNAMKFNMLHSVFSVLHSIKSASPYSGRTTLLKAQKVSSGA